MCTAIFQEIWIYIWMHRKKCTRAKRKAERERERSSSYCLTDVNAFLDINRHCACLIWMLMFTNSLKNSDKHIHTHIFFLFSPLSVSHTHPHENNAGTAWTKQSMLGFSVHSIHRRMLEKAFIKGLMILKTHTRAGDPAYNLHTFVQSYQKRSSTSTQFKPTFIHFWELNSNKRQ